MINTKIKNKYVYFDDPIEWNVKSNKELNIEDKNEISKTTRIFYYDNTNNNYWAIAFKLKSGLLVNHIKIKHVNKLWNVYATIDN